MHESCIVHGFIQAILMSVRQQKKLNFKACWHGTCIQNKLICKVKLFICPPDVKVNIFQGLPEPPAGLCHKSVE